MKSQSAPNLEEQLLSSLRELESCGVEQTIIDGVIQEIQASLSTIEAPGPSNSVKESLEKISETLSFLQTKLSKSEQIPLRALIKVYEGLEAWYKDQKNKVARQPSVRDQGDLLRHASRIGRGNKGEELDIALRNLVKQRQQLQAKLERITRDDSEWLPEDENRITDMHHYMLKAAYEWCFPESEGYTAWADLSEQEQETFPKRIMAGSEEGKLADILVEKAELLVKALEAEHSVETIISFGDSLMDQGNMDRRMLLGVIPMSALAGLGQSRDGAFSDDLNWVGKASTEYVLAKMILRNQGNMQAVFDKAKIKAYVKGSNYNTIVTNDETGKATLRVKNYAEGGASAAKGSNIAAALMKTLAVERDEFLADQEVQESIDKSKTLIFEMTGANDMVTVNSSITDANMDRAVEARVTNISELYQEGFRHFLLGALPDLTLSASFQNMTAGEQAHAYRVATRYNAKIVDAVKEIKQELNDEGISIHIYDINQAFIGSYVKDQNTDPNWRRKRLNRTDLLDADLQTQLGLSKKEYHALQDTGLVSQMARVYRNASEKSPQKINDEINAFADKALAHVQSQLNGIPDLVDAHLEAQRAHPRMPSSGRLRRQLRVQLMRQKRALTKVFNHTYSSQELKSLAESMNDRESAYFYNALHPSSILYEDVEKDLLSRIKEASVRGMDDAFDLDFDTPDAQRTRCLTQVYANQARSNIAGTDYKAFSFSRDMNTFVSMLDAPRDESSPSELVFTAFMNDYTGQIASDFSSLTRDSMQTRLGSVLTRSSKTVDDRLTDIFYHALFNGGRRSRKVLQKLGYLTSPACQVGNDLLPKEREVVLKAVRSAYNRAESNKASSPTVKRRLKQLSGTSMKFEKALSAQEALLEAKELAKGDPKLIRCLDLYAHFYFKRANTRFGKPMPSLLEDLVSSSRSRDANAMKQTILDNRSNCFYTQQQRDDLDQAIKDSGLDSEEGLSNS